MICMAGVFARTCISESVSMLALAAYNTMFTIYGNKKEKDHTFTVKATSIVKITDH